MNGPLGRLQCHQLLTKTITQLNWTDHRFRASCSAGQFMTAGCSPYDSGLQSKLLVDTRYRSGGGAMPLYLSSPKRNPQGGAS